MGWEGEGWSGGVQGGVGWVGWGGVGWDGMEWSGVRRVLGHSSPSGLLEPGVRPSCTALAWSWSVMLPGVAKAARSLQHQTSIH